MYSLNAAGFTVWVAVHTPFFLRASFLRILSTINAQLCQSAIQPYFVLTTLCLLNMGVHGLWTYLKPSATTESLAALALDRRYTTGCPPFCPFVIGVDVSANRWLRDGPMPRVVKTLLYTHWMTKPTQHILDAFNIQWFMAKGEAEAELAAMNGTGMIDAVMTDDSDVFAFGGRLILRNSSLSDSTVDVYRANLPWEDYALVSLLCGSDYDPSWREDMAHQLHYDPMSRVGHCNPALADNISDTVPDINTWSAYLDPAVSEPLVPVCQPGVPDVGKIAAAVVSLLGWEDADQLLNTFHNKIWPGVVVSELLQDLSTWQPNNQDVALAAAATQYFFLHFACKKWTIAGLLGYNV
ncbi:PIN domain-like protein [Suillus bovinus]|uniref:PIN domain-like protein n=1 Tax=Suillus bovinus TaxID=48563 RepID=UPI001B862400|nr:PIN domain-like protein [Suillus bovinus]KAG2130467.1 PIN domain-like protein [Suillus bovinus]